MIETVAKFSGPEICALEAHEIVRLLRKKELGAEEVLDATFQRICQVEPTINAMPTLCEDRAKSALRDSNPADRLAGLPVAIKDLDRVENVRTTFGTLGLKDFVPGFSDKFVENIEANGGIVVGKTNTPELGAGAATFNDVFGWTVNPWDTSKSPAGSSGGAAAALASGEVWLAQGSDNAGSCRTPAAYCGVVGLRTSPGLVPVTKVEGNSTGFMGDGVIGPMARSVRDCALFLDSMCGFEPTNPMSFPPDPRGYLGALEKPVDKIRIAFSADLNGLCPVEPVIAAAMSDVMKMIEGHGASVEESCPDLSGLEETYRTLRAFGLAVNLGQLPNTITKHLKATIQNNWAEGKALSVDQIARANIERTSIFLRTQKTLKHFDVLACPVVGCMQPDVGVEWVTHVNGLEMPDYLGWLRFSFLATTTGLPAISIPIGLSPEGLPIGLQLIGRPRGEADLMRVALHIETILGGPFKPIDPRPASRM